MKYLLGVLCIFFSQKSFSVLDQKSITVSASRSIEFLTTFPTGDKVGYDVKAKKVINTFKVKNCGSCYALQAPDPEVGDDFDRRNILNIHDVFPGKYQVVFYPKITEEKEVIINIDNSKLIRSDFQMGYLFLWKYKASLKKDNPLKILFEVKNHDNNAIEVRVMDEFGKNISGSVLTKKRGLQVIQETKY